MCQAGEARAYIEARIAVEDRGYSSECWIWQGALNERGYARSRIPGIKRTLRIHRFTYELYVGLIPEGLTLDHLCKVKCCVNPAHLEPVTAIENYRRAIPHFTRSATKREPGRGRLWHLKETHCRNGHEYTPENTNYVRSCRTKLRTVRSCRICTSISNRKQRDKVKAREGLAGGRDQVGFAGLGTHCHSGTPLAASPPETGL